MVGNQRTVLISDLAGRSNIVMKAQELGFKITNDTPELKTILARIKELEHQGYEFEAAEASLAVLIRKILKHRDLPFDVDAYHVSMRRNGHSSMCEATVKVHVGHEAAHTVAEGDGPVNALDSALRAALIKFYPQLKKVTLTDYKVRILDRRHRHRGQNARAHQSTDGKREWGTVGVSENIIEASLQALVDSMEYALIAIFAGISLPAAQWVTYEGADGPGKGKHIVLLSGDEEYRSEEGLPQLGKILSQRHGFKCTVLFSLNPADGTIDPNNQTNVPGMKLLETADLVINQFRFRELPDSDMKYFVDYLNSGKPMIVIRTATHPFAYSRNKQSPYARFSWDAKGGGFGGMTVGETWTYHHGDHGKEMSEIPKAYEPQSVEDKWYDFWLKHGCFTADPARVTDKRPAYSIVIPPPNVTGMLHMGHVLNNTIQDILARKARMDGKEVLWLPGTDHAGIATQVQVEKALKKEERNTISAAKNSSSASGSGRKSTAASSSSSSRSSAARAIGRANASRWTRSIRAACRRCSSSFTRRASSIAANAW